MGGATFGLRILAAREIPAQLVGLIPGLVDREVLDRPDGQSLAATEVKAVGLAVAESLRSRTTMRRYTRLSNGLGWKIENHMAAVALNYFAYDFTDRLFDVADLVALLVESENTPRNC